MPFFFRFYKTGRAKAPACFFPVSGPVEILGFKIGAVRHTAKQFFLCAGRARRKSVHQPSLFKIYFVPDGEVVAQEDHITAQTVISAAKDRVASFVLLHSHRIKILHGLDNAFPGIFLGQKQGAFFGKILNVRFKMFR